MPAGARCRQSDKCFFSPFCFFGRYFQLFCSPQNDLTQRGRAGPSRQRANRKERERAPVRLDTAAQLDVRCGAADFLAVRRGVGLQKRARHAVKQFTHFWPQVSGLVEYVGPSRRAVKQFTHFWPQVSGLVEYVGPLRRRGAAPPPLLPAHAVLFKPSLRSSPVTPPIFRPLGQPETRVADLKVVTQ